MKYRHLRKLIDTLEADHPDATYVLSIGDQWVSTHAAVDVIFAYEGRDRPIIVLKGNPDFSIERPQTYLDPTQGTKRINL